MKLFDTAKAENVWYLCDEYGELRGAYTQNPCQLKGDRYTLTRELSQNADGVLSRKDALQNTSDAALTLSSLKSRFVLGGGDYEVYTQYNGWMNESRGGWQKLISG